MPRLNDRGFIKIKRGRHPLIAADAVVPLDLELGNDYSQIIVTGPNTGGKTVSLKTVGLLKSDGDVRVVCSCGGRQSVMCV